jgi:hypothetical protein
MKKLGHTTTLIIALLLLGGNVGCSSPPPQGAWLSHEQVNVRLRKKIGMEPGYYVRGCGRLINVGQFKTEKELRPFEQGEAREEIVIADGSSDFYDRRTGELVAECGYWSCRRDARECERSCPPREWKCGWEMP